MLLNYFKTNDFKLPQRHQLSISHDIKLQNIHLSADKETAMQIDDKSILNSIEEAVALATAQLKLAPSVLFQAKAVHLIEDISNYKNVIQIFFTKGSLIHLIKLFY